jgi:hypothetical protein
MAGTFEILARFLQKFGDEVEGRQLTELSQETRAKLTQLAHGKLEPAARTELMAQLSHNPDWVTWLAQEVKSLRGAER